MGSLASRVSPLRHEPVSGGAGSALSQRFTGRSVLITGGLGFIGSSLAARLVELGAKVLLVDALMPEHGGNPFNVAGVKDRVTINAADVRNERIMRYLVEGQEYLFNLAGQRSHTDSMTDPYMDLDATCRASLSVLEACRHVNPRVTLVYTSTRQVYGVPAYLPVDERHPTHPIDVNGANKLAGEHYHLVYARTYGIRTCVLRLTNVYGPRMRVQDARQTFLGWWIRRLLDGEPLPVYGDGAQQRDLSYIDDVVEAMLLAAASEVTNGEVYNIGGDAPVSLGELAELLIRLHGGGRWMRVPFPPAQKAIDIGSYYADDTKIRKALGWQPKIPLTEGLTRTLVYYRTHRTRYWTTDA